MTCVTHPCYTHMCGIDKSTCHALTAMHARNVSIHFFSTHQTSVLPFNRIRSWEIISTYFLRYFFSRTHGHMWAPGLDKSYKTEHKTTSRLHSPNTKRERFSIESISYLVNLYIRCSNTSNADHLIDRICVFVCVPFCVGQSGVDSMANACERMARANKWNNSIILLRIFGHVVRCVDCLFLFISIQFLVNHTACANK